MACGMLASIKSRQQLRYDSAVYTERTTAHGLLKNNVEAGCATSVKEIICKMQKPHENTFVMLRDQMKWLRTQQSYNIQQVIS